MASNISSHFIILPTHYSSFLLILILACYYQPYYSLTEASQMNGIYYLEVLFDVALEKLREIIMLELI